VLATVIQVTFVLLLVKASAPVRSQSCVAVTVSLWLAADSHWCKGFPSLLGPCI